MEDLLLNLAEGFANSLSPLNLLMMVLGCVIGLFVGAIPGLGSVNGVAILLPITFLVPPTAAIIFLAAIYYGAMNGGAISSIMLGVPGASTAVATVFDGRPLAMQGKAEVALVAAAAASFLGGTIAIIIFTLLAPPIAEFALRFGPPEIFALMLMAFTTFVGLGGDDIPKTLFSIFVGLALATVGLDIVTGQPRMIFFDIPGFFHGINFLVLAIGIYGIGEILWVIDTHRGDVTFAQAKLTLRSGLSALRLFKRCLPTAGLSGLLGFFVGVLPAAGATPAALMAYGMAKNMSSDPERYGKGEIKGVAAPESANNSASTGAMLPMLTLGVPGSPTTAIMLGGLIIWGLRPGPLLFTQHPDFVWGLITSLYLANVVTVVINLAFIPMFVWVLRLPFIVLSPIIYMLCVVGGYAPTNSMHDVWLMFLFGIAGYLLRKLDYPVAPAVLAIVLGPLAEVAFRQSLVISQGSPVIFVERPLSLVFIVIAGFFLLLPVVQARIRARRRAGRSEEPAQ